jgi:two-component sensor histidine kinase
MMQKCAEMETFYTRGSFAARRLLAENARLRRVCAQSEDIIARYELLLREGDHRIKNSLQIVASLMGMQERRETNPVARDALHAATARILAVARIHDALQLNGGKDIVDLGGLISTMCRSLQVMAGDTHVVNVVVNAERIETPIALAQPLVLAVNELVVNALRHAFPGSRDGNVVVDVTQVGDEVRIAVADDGVGLPANYLEGRGYGMNLVRMMISKIGGVLQVEGDTGTRFTLSAPAYRRAEAPVAGDAPALVAL